MTPSPLALLRQPPRTLPPSTQAGEPQDPEVTARARPPAPATPRSPSPHFVDPQRRIFRVTPPRCCSDVPCPVSGNHEISKVVIGKCPMAPQRGRVEKGVPTILQLGQIRCFICFVATAVRHCLKAWKTGECAESPREFIPTANGLPKNLSPELLQYQQ